jgi:hypothetical protein
MHRAAAGRSRFFDLLIHWSSHCISPWLLVPGVVRGHAGSSPSGARACAGLRRATIRHGGEQDFTHLIRSPPR